MKNLAKSFIALAIIATSMSCADNKKTNTEILSSTEWTLDSVATEDLSFILNEGNVVTITFSDSTTFAGSGGCNRYFGTFTTTDDTLIAIETKGRSMSMCPEIQFEDKYISTLDGVTGFTAEEGKLVLTNSKDEVLFIFTPTKE